jgi:hypothetical protein
MFKKEVQMTMDQFFKPLPSKPKPEKVTKEPEPKKVQKTMEHYLKSK